MDYYISSTGDNKRHKVTARTLLGAKRQATNYYQESSTGSIYVEFLQDTDFHEIAIKNGFNKWRNVIGGQTGEHNA